MPITYNWPTSATLAGARDFSRIHRVAAQEDVGNRIQCLVSAVNEVQGSVSLLNTAVSNINTALLSGMTATGIAVSGVFSALSGAGSFTSTGATVTRTVLVVVSAGSNFRA